MNEDAKRILSDEIDRLHEENIKLTKGLRQTQRELIEARSRLIVYERMYPNPSF